MMEQAGADQPDMFATQDVCVRDGQGMCVQENEVVCVPSDSGVSLPLKERVRGSAAAGAFEVKLMRYTEQLQKFRADAARLRDSFGRVGYSKGTRQLKLHFWQRNNAQGDEFALRWRWSWKQGSPARERFVYAILPLGEILADPQNGQHLFVRDFLDEIRGTPLFAKVMEIEFERVNINVSLRQARIGKANNAMLVEAVLFRDRMIATEKGSSRTHDPARENHEPASSLPQNRREK